VGNFDGETTIESLKRQGDFGLGTFNALDGEMIVLDGNVYQARDDGHVYLSENVSQTPFAVVTFFNSKKTVRIKETLGCNDLHTALDSIFPDLDMPYAIKISGDYASLKLRAPPRQTRPYKTLSEALVDQAIFELGGVTGTMVGFRLPGYMAGLNAPGYHFHFISDNRLQGGHVLDCVSSDVTVMADTLESVHADLSNRR